MAWNILLQEQVTTLNEAHSKKCAELEESKKRLTEELQESKKDSQICPKLIYF